MVVSLSMGLFDTCGNERRIVATKPKHRASLKTPSKKFKGDSRYTGSDEDDDYNNVTMNKCFVINSSALDDN